jgi:hypothetical protein
MKAGGDHAIESECGLALTPSARCGGLLHENGAVRRMASRRCEMFRLIHV